MKKLDETRLVSIVIPAFNHEKFVRAAIESVISQSYENWELIIINDGSTDNTGAVIDEFAGSEKIKIIHQENRGLSAVLNQGLEMAQGEYFGFLPSDDMFYRDKLLIQVDFLNKHHSTAGVGSFQTLVDEQGRHIEDRHMEKWFSYEPCSRSDFLLKLLERNFVPAPSMLLKTQTVREAGGFDVNCRYMQDYDLWFRILKNHDMNILPRPLIYYRWHGGNLTFQATDETEEERGRVFEKAARLLDITDLYPQLWDAWRPELIALCRSDLFERLSKNPTPNFEEVQGLFDEKFTKVWRKRKNLNIPATVLEKISPCYLSSDTAPPVMLEVSSLDSGGLEQVVYDLAVNLSRRKIPLVVTCVDRGGLTADRLKEKGIKVEILPLNNKTEAYRRIIESYNIRLINSHYSGFGAEPALELAVPFVSTVHNIYAWLPGEITEGIRQADPLISHYIAVSHDVGTYLVDAFNIDEEKISVIPNGLDIDIWKEKERKRSDVRKEAGLSEDAYIFLCVASISRIKGQDRIIKAMPRVLKRCPEARAVLVGERVDLSYASYLDRLIRELGLEEAVKLREFEPDPSSWYFSADAFVLPSVIEGWSISMMEAMFAGLPLIMTDVGGASGIISREKLGIKLPRPYKNLYSLRGNFLEQYSLAKPDPMIPFLQEAMIEFCKNRKNWKKRGLRGRNVLEQRYSLKKQAEQYQSLFQAVMLNYSPKFLSYYNRRFHDCFNALELSQRTIEKVYEQQRQGYWLQTLNQQLRDAWTKIDSLTEENRRLTEEKAALEKEFSQKIEGLKHELETIYNSKGWKLLTRYRNMAARIKNAGKKG